MIKERPQPEIPLGEELIERLLADTERSYDELSTNYQTDPLEHLDEFQVFLNQQPKGLKRVLFIGCGPADDIIDFQNRAEGEFYCEGIDKSTGMVAEAKRRHPEITVTQMDMQDIDNYQGENWDAVFLPFSLIHVRKKHIPGILTKVYDKLKDGGLVYFALQESLDGRPRETVSQRYDDPKKLFMNATTLFEMLEELETAGLEVLAAYRRPPREEEHQFNKLILFARKPLLQGA